MPFKFRSLLCKYLFKIQTQIAFSKHLCNYINNMAAAGLAPTVKLSSGYHMPILGLGTYGLKKKTCEIVIREAIKMGYRYIDTAYLYGNEYNIGKALLQLINEKQIMREEIFICTKLWSIFHEPHRVQRACKLQLNKLQLNYIDLYLMHHPIAIKYNSDEDLMPHRNDELFTDNTDYVCTYKAMEDLVRMGWVRNIGLSNFNASQIIRILDNCQIKPVVNQVECHPGLNQQRLREFCQEHDIILCAYSPLGRPTLSKPLPNFYRASELNELAVFYKKTKVQIILRYLLDIGAVPLPKTSKVERLSENFNIFDFNLSSNDIDLLNKLDTHQRFWCFDKMKHHKYYPFNDEF